MHQLVDLTTNDDWGLARTFVELGDSPRPDGILPMSVVGDIEAGGGLTIPDWSLSWVHGVHNLYRYEGDLAGVRRHLPTVARILRWYDAYVDDRGTIADVPEWNLVDWSALFLSGRSAILTALWARGLRRAVRAGRRGGRRRHRRLGARAARGGGRGLRGLLGRRTRAVRRPRRRRRPPPGGLPARHATAVVSGLAPRERWASIMDTVTDPDRSSLLGSAAPTVDTMRRRWPPRSVGRSPVDWDTERETVSAEPFGSYLVHDAVAAPAAPRSLVDLVRRWDVFLTDGYDTFGECWGWVTPVHGWSATPSRDLRSRTSWASRPTGPAMPPPGSPLVWAASVKQQGLSPRRTALSKSASPAPTPGSTAPYPLWSSPRTARQQQLPAPGIHTLIVRAG